MESALRLCSYLVLVRSLLPSLLCSCTVLPGSMGTNVNAPFFKFSHQNSGTVPVLQSHVETLHWGEAAKWVLRPSSVSTHFCWFEGNLLLCTPIFFKIASDRMKWSKYVRRKVWTHHHFVLVPMHWYSGTTCEQALGLQKMKAIRTRSWSTDNER